jgi:hypothetical protein
MIEINRVGQVPNGLISRLAESCLVQHANHFLPAVLHSDHSSPKNRCVLVGGCLPVIVIRAGSRSYPPLHSASDQCAGCSPVSSSHRGSCELTPLTQDHARIYN